MDIEKFPPLFPDPTPADKQKEEDRDKAISCLNKAVVDMADAANAAGKTAFPKMLAALQRLYAPRGRVYICGPMSGLPQSNYPAFFEAEENLLLAGWEVENPASNPDPTPKTWENFMRLSIPQLCKCTHVCLLPDHEKSRGARMEVFIAKELGVPVHPLSAFIDNSV